VSEQPAAFCTWRKFDANEFVLVITANRYSREIPLGPSHMPVSGYDPIQCRMMDKSDIKAARRWHIDAARRARKAGFS